MAPTALDVLRALHAHTRAKGLPPPAALIGDWAGVDAVIAPSIDIRAGVRPPDDPHRFWFGHYGFPVRADESALPPVVGGLTDQILILNDGQWSMRVVDGSPSPTWPMRCVDAASREVEAASGEGSRWSATWTAPERDPHLRAIDRCLAAIREGEVYQACVCTRFRGQLTGAAVQFYSDLTATTRPAKSAFLQGDWGSVASFSPETYLRRTGNIVSSSPIKGTIAADADPSMLTASAKDIAENIMIVDLVRNDLGRLAVTGSVRVADLLSLVPAPGVWHLVSRVEALLDPGVGNDALLAATFPPASVTGTPKLRAMELLADWEASARGVYCGAIGLAGPDHLLDLNVAIRTVEITPAGSLELGVGGGITIDSDPHREWQECLDKASTIINARPAPPRTRRDATPTSHA